MLLTLFLRRVRALIPYFPEPRRTLLVVADPRRTGITQDARRSTVAAEPRATFVAQELRTLAVPAAPSTLHIVEG